MRARTPTAAAAAAPCTSRPRCRQRSTAAVAPPRPARSRPPTRTGRPRLLVRARLLPKEIQETVKLWRGLDGLPLIGGVGELVGDLLDQRYKNGHPYKDYNLDKQGEGMFWAAAVNPNRKDDPEASACDKPPFWVDNGDTPDEPLALTPQVLAEYAYDELPVPGTEIEMKPAGATKVNLPTWIWLDKAKFKKISVTASLPGTGLSATTTAEPVSLHIDRARATPRRIQPPGTARSTPTAASGSRTRTARRTTPRPAASPTSDPPAPTARTPCRRPSPGRSRGPAPRARAATSRTARSAPRRT